MKQCNRCNEVKPLEAYAIERLGKDGLKAGCKKCLNTQQRQRRGLTPALTEEQRYWARRGSLRAKEGFKRAKSKGHSVECKEERKKIRKVYEYAVFLEEITGVRYDVDHRVAYVEGGTHCASNLQILTEEQHKRKTKEESVRDAKGL